MNKELICRLIGKQIRLAREARGLTQETMAGHLNVSRPTYISYELGKQTISVADVYTIATILEIELHDLLPSLEDLRKQLSPHSSLVEKDDKRAVKKEIEQFLFKIRND